MQRKLTVIQKMGMARGPETSPHPEVQTSGSTNPLFRCHSPSWAVYFIPLPLLSIVGHFVGLLAWNVASEPDTDINAITISLSVIQVVLALLALMLWVVATIGFWVIRGAAVASAKGKPR